jgi:hypothetical protein
MTHSVNGCNPRMIATTTTSPQDQLPSAIRTTTAATNMPVIAWAFR